MATATEPKNGTLAAPPKASLISTMAAKQGIEADKFLQTVKATVIGPKASQEECIAFLLVANKYDLNPFTKEIYAFPKTGGGIQPIVSIDGWAKIVNEHKEFDGMAFDDVLSESGALVSVTCRMFRKDRTHPTECTEYMAECARNTEPWKKWPRRMLRHKAMIQAARYAFGLSGIMDEDEAERAEEVGWSQPQGKVGVSNVNKLLDAMPSHNPQEATQDADEYIDAVDDAHDDDYSQADPEPKTKAAAKPAPAEAEADAATMRMLIERIKDAETPMELGQVRDDIGALSLGKMQRAELEAMLGKRQKEVGK